MSERGWWKTNSSYKSVFTVTTSLNIPVTGLVNTDFGKLLYKDGAISTIPVTVTAIGTGIYYASYIPSPNAYWSLTIIQTAYNTAGWQDDVQSYTDDFEDYSPRGWANKALSSVESTLPAKSFGVAMANLVNWRDVAPNTLTVYTTDNSTVLVAYTLVTTFGQAPIIGIHP